MTDQLFRVLTQPPTAQSPAEKLRDLAFPRRCVYCGTRRSRRSVCPRCARQLRGLCPTGDELDERLRRTWVRERLAVWQFDGPLHRAVLLCKYQQQAWRGTEFGRQMAASVAAADLPRADMILCVPDSEAVRRRRQYSLPDALAQAVAAGTGIPMVGGLLIKRLDTPAQHTLPQRLRAAGPVGAFVVTDPAALRDKTVWLVDDMVTTGATMNTCARLLWLYGAKQVVGLCYGVTPAEEKEKGEQDGAE